MGKLAIEIKQGETFTKAMRIKDDSGTPLDLTGATVSAQIRKASDNTHIAEFDVDLLDDDWYLLTLEPEITAELPKVQGLFWDSRVQLASGTVYFTGRDSVTVIDTITEA